MGFLLRFLRTLLGACLLLLLAGLLGSVIKPAVETAWYAARLTTLPAPSHMPSPVQGVTASSLRDSWHVPRDGGARRHEGMDIFAPRGRPVLSATEGVVLGIGVDRLGGKVVWMLGPGGQRHYYAHLDRYGDLRRGQRIVAGQVLGYVGNTGNARGGPTHLHYGIYTARGPINPYPLLHREAHAGSARRGAPQPAF